MCRMKCGRAGGRGMDGMAATIRILGLAVLSLWAADSAGAEIMLAPPEFLFPGTGVIAVEAADVEADGDVDIVVPGISNLIAVVKNQGGGLFDPAETYPAGALHFDIAVADLNADERADLAMPTFDAEVLVWLNRGDGTFFDAVSFPTQGVAFGRAIAAADFDEDDDADLLIGDGFDSAKVLLLNDGNGSFDMGLPFVAGGTSISIAAGDVDGDGDADAVSVFSGIWLHVNNGDGTFAPAISLDPGEASSVAAGDLNGDEHLDFAASRSGVESGLAVVFLNGGDGLSYDVQSFVIDGLARDIAIGDLDLDGHPDLATSHVNNVNRVNVLRNTGDGSFEAPLEFFPGFYPQSVAIADIDGDGLSDVITGNELDDPPNVGVLLNETPILVPGDLNCDAQVNGKDVPALVLALVDPAEYEILFGDCNTGNGDLDGSGNVNQGDIPPFIDAVLGQ